MGELADGRLVLSVHLQARRKQINLLTGRSLEEDESLADPAISAGEPGGITEACVLLYLWLREVGHLFEVTQQDGECWLGSVDRVAAGIGAASLTQALGRDAAFPPHP